MGKTITLALDFGSVDRATASVSGLDRSLQRLSKSLNFVLMGQSLSDYMQTALEKTGQVDDELLVMRLALGKLRVAIGDAFAPIAQVLLPAINDAIFAAIRFVRLVSRITHALFGIDESASDATAGQEEFADAVTASSKAVQRSLAGFDRLNRLQASAGSVSIGGSSGSTARPNNYDLNLEEYLFVETLRNMWNELKAINLNPIKEAWSSLKKTLEPILSTLGDSFLWFYQFVLVPMAKWAAETLLPKALDTFSVALQTLHSVIEACKPALLYLWENLLVPLGRWVADKLLENLDNLKTRLTGIGIWMSENQVTVGQLLLYLSQFLGKLLPLNDVLGIFRMLGIDTGEMLLFLQTTLAGISPTIGEVSTYMDALNGKVNGLESSWQSMFTGANSGWQKLMQVWGDLVGSFGRTVWEPVQTGFRSMGNNILRILETMGIYLSDGFNGLFGSLNDMSFEIPDWIPIIGGRTFSFSLGKLFMPQIPALAQGAVLPANKPFLAMVGDQRHGTNIEAPLSTIQDAVRLEMQDLMEGSIAGQEATICVLRQILEAVLGISLTEDAVGAAAERYRGKMAMVHGF